MRRRLLFVTALVISLVAGAAATANRPAEAAFPGMNGKIAFRSDRDGNLEVYVMNPDGSDQVNISNNPALRFSALRGLPTEPGSPSAASRDGNSEIYKMRAGR